MRKIMIAALAVCLFSCSAEDKKEADTKGTAAPAADSTLPFKATYSSKFEMGDAKNAEAILAVWKAWDDGNLQASRKFFADSMLFSMREGTKIEGKTDSILVGVQTFRSMFASIKSTVHAYMPLKSTDKNESWVSIWGTEVSTDKQGKVDSVGLQETWRFNKDGKINLVYQYGRLLPPPSK